MFGFCITHILNTGCAKIWKKKSVAKRLNYLHQCRRIFGTLKNKSVFHVENAMSLHPLSSSDSALCDRSFQSTFSAVFLGSQQMFTAYPNSRPHCLIIMWPSTPIQQWPCLTSPSLLNVHKDGMFPLCPTPCLLPASCGQSLGTLRNRNFSVLVE